MITIRKFVLVVILLVISIAGLLFISFNMRDADDESTAIIEPQKPINENFKVRPLTNVKYKSTKARLERGRYLTTGVLQCFICHSPRKWDAPGAPPMAGTEGSGGVVMQNDSTRFITTPNITPDNETGAGKWTDDMIARAIREGVGHDGRALAWPMPSPTFRSLADEDVAAVVVYLRSIPAIHNLVPPVKISAEERRGMESSLAPITKPVELPDPSDPIAQGRYLVKLGECVNCHTSHANNNPGLFGGGNDVHLFERNAFSANLTSDPSGISYGSDAFKFVMRTGKGGLISPMMPWIVFKNMSDSDLKIIYEYLRTFPPLQHYVTNQKPFSYCAICEVEHGLGDKNKAERLSGIKIDPALFDEYAGTYLSEVHNWLYIISRDGDNLMGQQVENGPKEKLVALSGGLFRAMPWPIAFSFVRDQKGRVTELKEDTDLGERYKKIK